MGLFSKVKDILFEDEEIVEPEKVVKEEKPEKKVQKKIEKNIEKKEEVVKPVKEVEKKEKIVQKEVELDDDFNSDDLLGERDLFKSDKTFPFPDFDEEEFSSSVSRSKPKAKATNVLEYERKKKIEKRTDYGRYEKTEIKETVEKKKFRPSPIISPVYGILNEDYTINDIKERASEENIDVDWVRKKAFEPEKITKEEPQPTYYEESVTVKVKQPEDEKIQKGKTIDDLLEDNADVIVDVKSSRENKSSIEYEEIEDDFNEENVIEELDKDDDTLENDLFDLIDSMYENREDGDY